MPSWSWFDRHNKLFWYAVFLHAEAIEDYTRKCAGGIDDNFDVVYAHTYDEDDDDNSYKVLRVLCVKRFFVFVMYSLN